MSAPPVEPPGSDGRPPQRSGAQVVPDRSRAVPGNSGFPGPEPHERVSEGVHMRIRSTIGAVATAGAVALLTAGCLSSGGGGGGNDNTSNTISVMYAFSGGQEEGFKKEVNAWASQNDVTVKFQQTGNFNQLINTKVQGNDAPDVALFPQPGIMKQMADRGLLADLSGIVDKADLDAVVPGALQTGQVDGTQYAVPMSINVKSIVFYPKQGAQAAGLTQPPTTYDQL